MAKGSTLASARAGVRVLCASSHIFQRRAWLGRGRGTCAVILPHPRSPGGKPQRLTARVKIASARPYFPQPRFAGGANFRFVCVSVCLSVVPERRPKFGSKSGARCSFERGNPNFSTGRRGFDVTATLLALLRHKSRRRRAPRPAAGPPTHAIAGTRARAVTMATVRPPSLLNHSRRLASCRAPRHCRLSTPPSSRDGGVE